MRERSGETFCELSVAELKLFAGNRLGKVLRLNKFIGDRNQKLFTVRFHQIEIVVYILYVVYQIGRAKRRIGEETENSIYQVLALCQFLFFSPPVAPVTNHTVFLLL